ncbi:MAG: hypothetical protein ABIG93_01435 [archaeon]
MPHAHKKWSKEEINFLVDKYSQLTANNIAKTLGRTKESIKNQSRKLNLKKEKISKWKKETIIKTFYKIKLDLCRTPRYNDLKKNHSGMLDAISREWQTYNNFLSNLNIKQNIKRWTKRDCINRFNEIKIDKVPTQKDLNVCTGLHKAIRRKWGTYSNFLNEQGLKPNFEIKWNKKSCKNEFLKITSTINKVPTSEELRKINYGLLGGILLNYGKYNKFLKELNLPLNTLNWGPEKCVNKFNEFMRGRHEPPTIRELSYKNPRLLAAIYRHFDGYNSFLKKLGHEPHYGYNDERWEEWENLVIETCKRLYKNVLIKPTLNNRKIPDIVVLKDNSLIIDKIIDAKLNAFCKSIDQDIKNYKPHCNKLEFWCMFKHRNLETKNTKILNQHQIKRLLKRKNQTDLCNKLENIKNVKRFPNPNCSNNITFS